MACMVGFLAISYWVMLRFTTPGEQRGGHPADAALLSQIYPLSIYFFSDALFALLAMPCVLLAMHINEGNLRPWSARSRS